MQRRQNEGFSLIELLIVVAIILVIASIALPSLMRARIAANEASAVATIRSITSVQLMYKNSYPDVGYAPDLASLGSGVPQGPAHADLLQANLSDLPHQNSGYTFSTTGTMSTFSVDSAPITPGTTGNRSFCTDTPAVIYWADLGVACTPGVNVLP